MHPKLLKADFHGSIMTGNHVRSFVFVRFSHMPVSQSKNTSMVGISGIVIHETEGTFKVVTKENKWSLRVLAECV